ncbi:MAG TPA: hypothetical protein VIW68_03555 [Candidatus Sulfotelmatobacter sp.]
MTRFGSFAMAVLFAASWCYGQSSAPASPTGSAPAAAKVVGHGSIPVTIKKTLDSSKLKEGDAIEVETSGAFKLADGTMVSKGTKVTGHVSDAKSRSKGDAQSELALTFDKINIPGGKQISVRGSVQAVFPPQEQADPGIPGASAHQGGPGNMPMPDYRPTNDIKIGSNTDSGANAEPAVNPKSVGIQGMHDLQLSPEGVLSSSKGKQVKLGQDVRMIVHVDILE